MTDKALVSVASCDHLSDDSEVIATVADVLERLRSRLTWLSTAQRIMIKTNVGYGDFSKHHGRYVAITDPAVVAGVVAFIRRYSEADILVGGAPSLGDTIDYLDTAGYSQRLAPYGVRLVDLNQPPYAEYGVPGGGTIFRSYTLSAELQKVDAVVSVAKLKAHRSTGVTATLKNLFGMTPVSIYGNPRRYLHAPVRLPRAVVDLSLTLKPVLGVIDALVASDRREWSGTPVETDLILAGDNLVATDATAMRFVGFDPADTYPHPSYVLDHSPVLLAAEAGLGPIAVEQISVDGVQPLRLLDFSVERGWSLDVIEALHRSTAEQALTYQQQRERIRDQYEGQYICMANGEVIWSAASLDSLGSRADMARRLGSAAGALFLKLVGPASEDPEHYAPYQDYLGD